MRTSRVNPVANSTFRNSRQYLHSNEQMFRVMQEDGGNPFSKNPREQQKRRNNQSNQQRRLSNAVLNRNSKRMIIKGQQFDGETIESMQRSLLHHAMKINTERNKRVRLRTYRNSI